MLLNIRQKYPSPMLAILSGLKLSFNIDGVPLFKSSKKSLWPILCAVTNLKPLIVFPVALTYGGIKPNNLDFLSDTIKDLNGLIQNGLFFEERCYTVSQLHCM